MPCIPEEAIRQLQEIHKKKTGRSLSDSDAQKMGMEILYVHQAILKPIKKNKETKNGK